MAKQKSADVEDEDLDEDEDSEGEGADKEDAEDDDQEEEDEGEEEDDDREPPTRNNLSHIISRQKKTIEKLRSQRREEDDDDEDDEVDQDQVGKAVRKTIAPLAKNLDQQQIRIEISTFLADPKNARFKKYERAAFRYASHPAYQNVPIPGIFKQLAFDDIESGSDESVNRERAQRQSAAGSSQRRAPTSDADLIAKAKAGDKTYKTIRERISAGETLRLEEE